METLPVEVTPKTGDARVAFTSAAKPIELAVKPGDSLHDDVNYTYLNTVSGEKYVLYSETHGIVRDSATASSPVYLKDDDSDEVLSILQENTSSSSTSDGVLTTAIGTGLQRIIPFIGFVGASLAAWYFYKRFIKGREPPKIVLRGQK